MAHESALIATCEGRAVLGTSQKRKLKLGSGGGCCSGAVPADGAALRAAIASAFGLAPGSFVLSYWDVELGAFVALGERDGSDDWEDFLACSQLPGRPGVAGGGVEAEGG